MVFEGSPWPESKVRGLIPPIYLTGYVTRAPRSRPPCVEDLTGDGIASAKEQIRTVCRLVIETASSEMQTARPFQAGRSHSVFLVICLPDQAAAESSRGRKPVSPRTTSGVSTYFFPAA